MTGVDKINRSISWSHFRTSYTIFYCTPCYIESCSPVHHTVIAYNTITLCKNLFYVHLFSTLFVTLINEQSWGIFIAGWSSPAAAPMSDMFCRQTNPRHGNAQHSLSLLEFISLMHYSWRECSGGQKASCIFALTGIVSLAEKHALWGTLWDSSRRGEGVRGHLFI